MTKEELREALHREMLFYYFAQRGPRLEIRTGESLISAVWRKVELLMALRWIARALAVVAAGNPMSMMA